MYGFDDTEEGSEPVDITGLRLMRRSPLLEEAWRYWSSLRRGHELPRRTDLDPRAMTLTLGHSMILDRVRPGTVRVRLGGHVVQELMAMEVRGLPIRAFFDLDDRTRIVDRFEQVFDRAVTLELDLISHGAEGVVTGRLLVLPLLDTAGRVSKALAVLATDRVVKDGPRRFSVTNSALAPIAGASGPIPTRRTEDAAQPYPLPAERAPQDALVGMHEAQTPFEGRQTSVPWLRVVK